MREARITRDRDGGSCVRRTLGRTAALLALACPALFSTQAWAQADEPPICTDRPTKANSVCTVPAGRVQVESDLGSWTATRAPGVRTDVIVPVAPVVKFGLGPATDIQLGLAPFVTVRTRTSAGVDRVSGAGDLTVRVKQRLTAADAPVQLALLPFVKAPTARRGIGNREWEGGMSVPVQFSGPAGIAVTLGPELDVLADADGRGRHLQTVGLVNLSRQVLPRFTVAAELWGAWNQDPAGTVRQYSADAAFIYLLAPNLQLDAGGNFGLNRATPDAQLYLGVSARF